ncbi:cytochrome P450 [Thozetella sp. PMI_491]|nr:cytochrome P450 [Thozetella sp. PMI_491]
MDWKSYLGDLPALCLSSGATGLFAHIFYFVHGNHNDQGLEIALAVFIVRHGALVGSFFSTAVCTSYLGTLLTSICFYRICFHPLARFPGPWAAKITKFYGPWIARNGRMHWEHTKISNEFGDFARIGPNELLIRSVDAIQKIHGAQSKCNKAGTFYEFVTFNGVHNLDSMPRLEQHRWRRQVWDRALNSKAQERYESAAREVTQDWLSAIAAAGGRPINTSLYSLLIPFDNIGKVGYSEDFGTIKAGVENRMINLMETNFKAAGELGQLAWPLGVVQRLGLSKDGADFDKLVVKLADKRVREDFEDKEDIMKYMLEDLRSSVPKSFFNQDVLYSDASVIMIGGTDTIAALLSYAFYELAVDASRQTEMRTAVQDAYGKTVSRSFADKDLESVEYLNAFINEILRMYSPVCNNGQRTTPPEGIVVDGVHIPGGTQLIVPVHSIHRYEKFFARPDEFIVERWTSRPELIHERKAFHPFLIGSFNCVGKRLALCLVRNVLASTVWHYDFAFAAGETGEDIHSKAINQLILKAGPLQCIFSKRYSAET